MAQEDKAPDQSIARLIGEKKKDFIDFATDERFLQLDNEKLDRMFMYRETERRQEFEMQQLAFEKQQKAKELDHTQNLELLRHDGEIKKLDLELSAAKIQLFYKMFISVVAMGLGTLFVFKGNPQIGFFLLGGGMSSATTGVLDLMRVAKEK